MCRTNKTFFISRALPLSIALLFTFFSIPPTYAQSDCLPVHGLTFERVDTYKLLAVREGRNIAFVNVNDWQKSLPSKLGTFRFFSPNLCTSGAEEKFTIDGVLYEVMDLEPFRR